MKKWLKEALKKKETRKKELGDKAKNTESIDELRSINKELEDLNVEIAEFRSKIDEIEEEEESEERGKGSQEEGNEHRSNPHGGFNPLATYGIGQTQQTQRSNDPLDTTEYRSAFMDYVAKGGKPEGLEFRQDQTTGTGDIGAVIPTSILNRIVEKLKDYGQIWDRVTKTSMKGGVQIPLSNAKPTATWVAAGQMANKQKKEATGNISFSYHKLQIRVAVEIVAETVSLPVFEDSITENIYEAMIVALEEGIIYGTGTGQPLGIVNDTDIPDSQIVNVSAEDLRKYDKWTEIYGKIPRKYRSGAVLIMADPDWSKYIEGMVDDVGQPVAKTNYGLDGKQQERLLGKEVLPVEDLLPSIDDAEDGDVIGILVRLQDYMFNSNMQLLFKRYFNEESDEWVSKSTLIGDGKLADRNGVVLLKKGTTP